MKYRVLRHFEGEEAYALIGHFDLKMQANTAIGEDRASHPNHAKELQYIIDEVEKELTQAEIDRMMIELRAAEEAKGR